MNTQTECPIPLKTLLTAYASSLFQPLDKGQRDCCQGAAEDALAWEPADLEMTVAIFSPSDASHGFEIIQTNEAGDIDSWLIFFDGSQQKIV